jgi:hypothetical protein
LTPVVDGCTFAFDEREQPERPVSRSREGRFAPAKPEPVRFSHREAWTPFPYKGGWPAKFDSICTVCHQPIVAELGHWQIKTATGHAHHPKGPWCIQAGKSRPHDPSKHPVIHYNAYDVTCPDCGAPPGHACRDEQGRPVPIAEARFQAAREACNLQVFNSGAPTAKWASRNQALETVCPFCGAPAGQHCVRSDGTVRDRIHRPRYRAAEQPTT